METVHVAGSYKVVKDGSEYILYRGSEEVDRSPDRTEMIKEARIRGGTATRLPGAHGY